MTPPKVNPLPKEAAKRELFANFQTNYDEVLSYLGIPFKTLDCVGIVFEPISYENSCMALVFKNGMAVHVNGALGDFYNRDGNDARIRYDNTSDGIKITINLSSTPETAFREFNPEQNNDTRIYPVNSGEYNGICTVFRQLEEKAPDYLQTQLDILQKTATWVRDQETPYPPVHL